MYLDKLVVSPLGDGKFWEVTQPFEFYSKIHNEYMTIPSGLLTDFASIPWFMQWFEQPASGKHNTASVVHDYLYKYGIGTREQADDLFLLLMKKDGVSWIKRHAMYYAVRLFGEKYWNGNNV